MNGITLYTSNRLENLSEKLAEILRRPLSSPLTPEIIMVQSKGMERWVSLELARQHEICANIRFPFPNHFINDLYKIFLNDLPEDSFFEPDFLTWKIMGLIPSFLEKPEFKPLKNYLREDVSLLKRFQISQRIAELFDRYLLFRPEMILLWEKGKNNNWQAILWRSLVQGQENFHPAALKRDLLMALQSPPLERMKELPERVAVFGISTLPPYHLQVFSAIAPWMEVNFFLMNPCREYWGDIVSNQEARRIKGKTKKTKVSQEDLHLERGNILLSSMGILGRDFFELITDLDCREETLFQEPVEENLLNLIQSDILNLRSGGNAQEKKPINPEDDSIQIHSCHSPLREIEILQDRLLALFETNPDLRPKDILVMTPDIETYAPFIQAVFSLPANDPRYIPFSVADRGIRKESVLINKYLSLLDLNNSRLTAQQVFSILEIPAVYKKFGLSELDLPLIQAWVHETQIRWGKDSLSRKDLGLPAFSENTWQTGLERMLLGYALPGKGESMFGDILPYDPIEGSDAKVLGSLLCFIDRLFHMVDAFKENQPIGGWVQVLTDLFEEFFLPDEDSLPEEKIIRQTLQELINHQQVLAFKDKIPFEIIKAYLKDNLEKKGLGYGFLTGAMTCCALLPMRSIPFEIICLVGMNDGVFPRKEKSIGFDLMANKPKIGDPSRRKDDRYLFLEALLSARKKMIISYLGQSIQDNSFSPPSVLVSELIDTIEQSFEISKNPIRESIITRHRLQAFSPEYFRKGGPLFSYSEENCNASQQMIHGRQGPRPLVIDLLSEPEKEWKNVDVALLCRFFQNPAKFLLQRRLNIFLKEDSSPLEDNEPFGLNALEEYSLGQILLPSVIQGMTDKQLFPRIKALGQLPHGTPGECFFEDLYQEVRSLASSIHTYSQGQPLFPVDVDLILGDFQIVGRLTPCCSAGLIYYRYAKVKAKDRFNCWIQHLILNAIDTHIGSRQSWLIGRDGVYLYGEISESRRLLKTILETYFKGLRKALPFFPDSSFAYQETIRKGKSRTDALSNARKKWEGNEFSWAERSDPYYQLYFRETDPLTEEFEALSQELISPILEGERKIE